MATKKSYKMSEQERQEYRELEDYVRFNIMGFTNEGLNRNMVLRLRGLHNGQAFANNKHDKHAFYTYKTILNTFKAFSPDIKRAFVTKHFKDDMHKFNYAMAIVDNNISTISNKMKNAELAQQHSESSDKSIAMHSDLSKIYQQRKSEAKDTAKKKNRLDDLW